MDHQLKVKEAYDFLISKGYNVAYVGIYGSQNYGLDNYDDEYMSDYDFKAVIVPSLENLVHNSKPLSTTIEYLDGQIDIKDVRVFTETLVKCNPAYIETLYTPFSIWTEDYKKIIDMRDDLIKEQGSLLIRAAFGMIKQKEVAFSHPYPFIKDKIEKFGYDPKQLHHIIRLQKLIAEYVVTGEYVMKNSKDISDMLLDIKKGIIELKDAEQMRDCYVEIAKRAVDSYDKEPTFETKKKIINLSRELIIKQIKKGIKK